MKTKKEITARAHDILMADYSEVDTTQATRDMIDDLEVEVSVCGIKYSPSRVLEELDPIAFRCTESEYTSSQESDNQWYSPDNGGTYYAYSDWEEAEEKAQVEADEEEESEEEESEEEESEEEESEEEESEEGESQEE